MSHVRLQELTRQNDDLVGLLSAIVLAQAEKLQAKTPQGSADASRRVDAAIKAAADYMAPPAGSAASISSGS